MIRRQEILRMAAKVLKRPLASLAYEGRRLCRGETVEDGERIYK